MRRTLQLVAILNLIYFAVEFTAALWIGSVSLFADGIDFLEDAAINLLILKALNWSEPVRARVGMALSGTILIPGIAALWMAWRKLMRPVPPAPWPLSLVGAGAFVVNFSCAILLARFRRHPGSHIRAAFLSARNDVLANVAIVVAGFLTAYSRSAWPDILVGLGIAALNATAAKQVYQMARQEHRAAAP